MRILLTFVVVLSTLSTPSHAADPVGYWARAASPFQEVRDQRRLIFPAPNGRAMILVDGSRVWVRVDQRVRHLDRDVGVGWPAELAWAADSSGFFITQTDGGIVGTWSTRAFVLQRNVVRVVDLAREAVPRFRAQYSCATADVPNTAAIAWLDGARRLLLATEVPPHSGCGETGKVAGYVVAVPSGSIERELTADALKREFGALLGPRLAGP